MSASRTYRSELRDQQATLGPVEDRPAQKGDWAVIGFAGTRDGEPLPWAHIDIAGPAFNESGAYDHVHKGGTGAAVATLVRMLENRAR